MAFLFVSLNYTNGASKKIAPNYQNHISVVGKNVFIHYFLFKKNSTMAKNINESISPKE